MKNLINCFTLTIKDKAGDSENNLYDFVETYKKILIKSHVVGRIMHFKLEYMDRLEDRSKIILLKICQGGLVIERPYNYFKSYR